MSHTANPETFTPRLAETLQRSGWIIAEIEAGLTLAVLRQQGAPFRGERYFHDFAGDVVETPTRAQTVAYRPALLASSMNRRYEECAELMAAVNASAPEGCRALIAPAAVYVALLWRHQQTTGGFPLAGTYTWTSNTWTPSQYPDGHLVVGIFGRDRPIVVGPHPKSGRGIGVMPVVVPSRDITASRNAP